MGVLGSVNKAPRECSLLLCTAPADCLPSVGRPPGVDLQGYENLWMQGKDGGRARIIPQGGGGLGEGPGNAARRVLNRERGGRRSDGLEGEETSQGLRQNLRWSSLSPSPCTSPHLFPPCFPSLLTVSLRLRKVPALEAVAFYSGTCIKCR